MIVYIISNPKGWDIMNKPYKTTYITVKKNSLRYFLDIIIEKLKGNDVSIIEGYKLI